MSSRNITITRDTYLISYPVPTFILTGSAYYSCRYSPKDFECILKFKLIVNLTIINVTNTIDLMCIQPVLQYIVCFIPATAVEIYLHFKTLCATKYLALLKMHMPTEIGKGWLICQLKNA